MAAIPATTNPDHGFYGTTADTWGATAEARWQQAGAALVQAGYTPLLAQRFLDTSWGRHLANGLERVSTVRVELEVSKVLATRSNAARMALRSAVAAAKDDTLWN